VKRNKNILIMSTLIFVAAFVGFIYYALKPPKGDRYYLPENYSGWICVSYNVNDAPQLETEDGFLVHKILPNGVLKTSSDPRLSPKSNEYFYYSKEGIRRVDKIKHGGGYSVQKKGQKEVNFNFWVISCNDNSDYEKYIKNLEVDFEPECGPWAK
jgi:hypothetical protein